MKKKSTELKKVTTIGERIRERREFLKWSQEKLAKKCGRTQGWIAHYESGRRKIDFDYLLKIATLLKVNAIWLQFGDFTNGKRNKKTIITDCIDNSIAKPYSGSPLF